MQARPTNKVFVFAVSALYSLLVFLPEAGFAKQNKYSDEVVFTCDEFPKKIQNCEEYSCYVTMGGVMTVTKILGTNGPYCDVSSTIGVTFPPVKPKQGEEAKPPTTIPVTNICQYDREGVNQLSNQFQSMKDGRFDYSGDITELGKYNCRTFALGQSFPTPGSNDSKKELWQ